MSMTESELYSKAFTHYLRHGTPVEISLKAMAHPTPLYIWRTAGDDKVRPSHATNDGKIFAWAHPPETGNPGEAPGCRCWAEPVTVDTTPLDILLLLAGGGLVRGISREALQQVIRRVETPPPKPAEPPPLAKPEGIPKDWVKTTTRKDGVQYTDPNNSHNYVRIERGNPNNSNPGQRVPYVRWQKTGRALDKNGNIVSRDSLESHIPLDKFKFDPEIFQ